LNINDLLTDAVGNDRTGLFPGIDFQSNVPTSSHTSADGRHEVRPEA